MPEQERTYRQMPPIVVSDSSPVHLEVLLNAYILGERGSPQRVSVPLGRVIVLIYGGGTMDAIGLPEVYLAGEEVSKNPLRGRVRCWAIELAEFPGSIDLRMTQHLAAISTSEDDLATLHFSLTIRLYDPILLLRRAGGKWESEKDRQAFNQNLEQGLRERLEHLLEGRAVQFWSGDESAICDEMFEAMDEHLRRFGMRVDEIKLRRHYPPNLYELALQFNRAEQYLKYWFDIDRQDIAQKTGLSEETLSQIVRSEERQGVALFRAIIDSPNEVKSKIATWLNENGLGRASTYLRALYLDQDRPSEREVRLSEQVLLSAIRDPWLTWGERLRRVSELSMTRFQQIEETIKRLGMGTEI